MRCHLAFAYKIITRNRTGQEHVRPFTSADVLAPGTVLVLGGRYSLVERVEQERVYAGPARYRLTLRHPDGRKEEGAFRRFRADAPVVGHQFTTLENGAPISWAVLEQHLAHDAGGGPFLESIAERDYAETESLPDHELEHALERESDDDTAAAAAMLSRAADAGLATELVGLEPGQAPDWEEATSYLDSLILEELEDDLIEQCGVNPGHDRHETWLDIVQRRLRNDLESFRTDIEGLHDEIEEWGFRGARIFATVGRFDDDVNPSSGFGWMCRLVDSGVLLAAGFYRARKPLIPIEET
jgi:hypothetical protein